jgi:flavin reductase (DIM6/NTAB) family NADH-FMN oxidoreductase RutF
MGSLDYPMFVVTAVADGEVGGCLVGFATQCSIDPPRFLACISKANRTFRVAARATHLAVHVLDRDDAGLARHFGSKTGDDVDKFDDVAWSAGPGGVPLLDDIESRFAGEVLDRFDVGDHVAHLLAPVDVETDRGQSSPLMFQDVKDLDPGHEATEP